MADFRLTSRRLAVLHNVTGLSLSNLSAANSFSWSEVALSVMLLIHVTLTGRVDPGIYKIYQR